MKVVFYHWTISPYWLQRRDSNPRFLAYETKRMTTSILCDILVSVEGIEPPPHGPKPRMIPFHHTEKKIGALCKNRTHTPGLQNRTSTIKDKRAKNLVDRERIELSISGCKPDVFPLALTAQSNIQLISLYTVCKGEFWLQWLGSNQRPID